MFDTLLQLRLVILESCNELPEDEQDSTARAWSDILELEASRLIDSEGGWLPADLAQQTLLQSRQPDEWGRLLGHADAWLSLIFVDQAVVALIRGHLDADATPAESTNH